MSNESMTDAQRSAIEDRLRALSDEKWAASEQLDADRMFANFSDAYGVGFMCVGTFFPSLDEFGAFFRGLFSQRKEQAVDVRETRVSVLAPTVAVVTFQVHVSGTLKNGQTFQTPSAVTFVCANVGDDWKVVHAHESLPIRGDS